MGRKRYKNNFQEYRGRWVDNKTLVKQVIDDSQQGLDWSIRIKKFSFEYSKEELPEKHRYKYAPDLKCIIFDKCDLSKTNFSGSLLEKATAFHCKADEANFSKSFMNDSKWGDSKKLFFCNFSDCKAVNTYFGHCNIQDSSFENSILRRASFRGSILKKVNFKNADLRFAILTDVHCENVDFSGAKLYGASLWNLDCDKITCDNIDISKKADGSVIVNNLQFASLLLSIFNPKKALDELISIVKFNSIVILGNDSEFTSYNQLHFISNIVTECKFIPIIIREQKEIIGESYLQKAIMYSLLSKFVLIENSTASGHLLELKAVLDSGAIIGVIQKKGTGATKLLDQVFQNYNNVRSFFYTDDIREATMEAIRWCEEEYGRRAIDR